MRRVGTGGTQYAISLGWNWFLMSNTRTPATSGTDIDACAEFADALIPRPVFADYGYVRARSRRGLEEAGRSLLPEPDI